MAESPSNPSDAAIRAFEEAIRTGTGDTALTFTLAMNPEHSSAVIAAAKHQAEAEKWRQAVPARQETVRSLALLIVPLTALLIFASPLIRAVDSGKTQAAMVYVTIILGSFAIAGGERVLSKLVGNLFRGPAE